MLLAEIDCSSIEELESFLESNLQALFLEGDETKEFFVAKKTYEEGAKIGAIVAMAYMTIDSIGLRDTTNLAIATLKKYAEDRGKLYLIRQIRQMTDRTQYASIFGRASGKIFYFDLDMKSEETARICAVVLFVCFRELSNEGTNEIIACSGIRDFLETIVVMK